MPDVIESLKPPEESLNYGKRGRFIGGMLALMMTMFFNCFVFYYGGNDVGAWNRIALGLEVSFLPAIITVPLGICLGDMASKCATTPIAFLRGACCSSLFVFFFFFPTFLVHYAEFSKYPFSQHPYFFSCFLAIFVAQGSLLTGIAAIYIRDYWKFKRKRWIPQFSLREMLICFTLISVVIAFFTVLTRLK
jgi:hypothetical protein